MTVATRKHGTHRKGAVRRSSGGQNRAENARRKARAQELKERPIEFMYHESFDEPGAEEEILGPAPESPQRNRLPKAPSGLPPYLASLYQYPLLTREQEAYYFRKMNYLKYKASQLLEKLNPSRPGKRRLEEIETLLHQADEVKNLLIRRNLRLVVSIAKKFVRDGMNFFAMVSDGNVSLMRAIEKFDFSRGFKFSTYATWAIRRNFARSIPSEQKYRTRYRTGTDELFSEHRHEGTSLYKQEQTNRQHRDVLKLMLKELTRRDREIIKSRFGLRKGAEPQTLEQVGQEFGVSKERIRQIEGRALRKLREFAEEEQLDIPELQ